MRSIVVASAAIAACSFHNGGPANGTDAPAASAIDAAPDASAPSADAGPPGPRVIAYLPNYRGSYADWAGQLDFASMTHLNLAFARPDGDNVWSLGASDEELAAIVGAAHAHGVAVLASLGGGGGDQSVIVRYRDARNIPALVASLDAFVAQHDLDGVDLDIEDAGALGDDYSAFVDQTIAALRPKGKLVTAAVAQYLQDGMSDQTLHAFDFVNVMIYSSYDDSVAAMTYYTNDKGVPPAQVVLGAGFFGTDSSGAEYGYPQIVDADADAWTKDETTVNGRTVRYTGVPSMKKLAAYAKGFGGIMIWEITLDVPGEPSLWKAIQASQ
ncbi:MAG TPA: glycosyl hydrolase family 18 protein [Kofleriaceae bacterium]|jgi:GH18 family chitinase|nr:glycosyl hydrolase family 18 protein [Kofleriaceae bacterium]